MSDTTSNTAVPTAGQGSSAYDAAKNSPTRSSFLAFPYNSRRELTPLTRREIVKKHRALEANCPFLTRIIRKSARHAVGSGIHFNCLSDDDVFNDAMRRDVEEWWNNKNVYSIDGSVDGWEAKRLAAETIQLDGEYNAALAYHPDSGFPCIQPLDVFEVGGSYGLTPPLRPGETLRDWDDGVRINEYERPIEYAVRTLPRLAGDNLLAWRYIPADSMIHLFRRRRAHGTRGLPWGYSGINQGIDALDLNALVTGTAKLHSALAVTVKGMTGRKGKRGALNKIQSAGSGDPNASLTDTQALEKIFGGGMINYLGESGELSLLSSQNPGPNVLAFIEMLFHQLAVGWDIPFTVLWDMAKAGGTAARYDAEDAQSAFDLLFDQIVYQMVRREIIWKVSVSIKTGRIAQSKDPWWFSKLVFRGPRKLTVDVGRMATAFKTLTRSAGMSIPRWFEEQGLDPIGEMREHILFLKKVKAMCEEADIDFGSVFEPTPGVQNNIQVTTPEDS
ncbi:phage portal protein [Prosthecobacter sp.]|uniref:phage portal protein n=1 Tax=Prosthecobacter sp. TaxID=1965333 RepID=UPI00378502BF